MRTGHCLASMLRTWRPLTITASRRGPGPHRVPRTHAVTNSLLPWHRPRRPTMTAIFRTALLAALAAVCIPAVAAGQDTSTDSLPHRIELLERANTDLERRVRELESLIRSKP